MLGVSLKNYASTKLANVEFYPMLSFEDAGGNGAKSPKRCGFSPRRRRGVVSAV